MKKKLIGVCVFLIILVTTTIVQAVELNIQMTIPQDYKQTKLQDEKNQIYLHATNEAQDESVIIVQLENDFTKRISNLGELNELNFNTILEQYNKEKEKTNQTILKQENYRIGELLFIDTVFEQTTDNKKMQIEEYYTLLNGKAIIISVNFLNKEVDTLKVRNMINTIEISKKEETKNGQIYLWIILAMTIVLIVTYIVKTKKNKIELEENEKKRVLQSVIDYMNKRIDYSKFKGILILFSVTIILNIINLFVGVIQGITNNQWLMSTELTEKIYGILSVLQNVIQLIGVIYIAYCLTKKEAKTIRKVQNTFLSILIGVIILTITRLSIQAVSFGVNQNLLKYVIYETEVFIKSMVYVLVWYCYFKNSIRVSVYYDEKSLEQIIKEPKKGYQKNLVNKKIMEYKIIEYFKQQKAFDYASGIYINKLPKEYAGSLSLSDLNSKKIIRLKKAKYYLSKKDLENPKTENKKAVKTVGSIILVYLFVLLILSIL